MSPVSVEFLAVRTDDLTSMPEAFQKYVEAYFTQCQIFGVPCLAAIRAPYWYSLSACAHRVAPSHSVDVDRFKGGLPDGLTLFDWMRDEMNDEERASRIFVFRGSWDDGEEPIDD